MTSFDSFRLLKFNKNLDFIYIFILFCVTSYIISSKKIVFFASNYGIITNIKIKLCK